MVVRDKDVARCLWQVGLVEEAISSADGLVQKVRARPNVNVKLCRVSI